MNLWHRNTLSLVAAVLLLIFLSSCIRRYNPKEITIKVVYAPVFCPCEQWIETKYQHEINLDYQPHRIYIESESNPRESLENISNLSSIRYIELRGFFLEQMALPLLYRNIEGMPEPGRMFIYNSYKIVR